MVPNFLKIGPSFCFHNKYIEKSSNFLHLQQKTPSPLLFLVLFSSVFWKSELESRSVNLVTGNVVVDGVPANLFENLVSPAASTTLDSEYNYMTGNYVGHASISNIEQQGMSQIPGTQAQHLQRVTKLSLDDYIIGEFRTRIKQYPRYVTLNSTEMFAQLVKLYSVMFKSQWWNFKTFLDAFVIPQGVEPPMYAARVYISTWFFDLYCSIHKATREVYSLDFDEKYCEEFMSHISTQYDAFLALLNQSLRPTHIQYTPEDTLYIPLIANNPNWTMQDGVMNPFGITDFVLNSDMFDGILQILIDNKHWKIQNLSSNTMGRPFWLFDWHDEQTCCAWFPKEGNYDDTDIALAYIVGVTCTPNLGIRDVDDWQFPPNGFIPTKKDIQNLSRVDERRFFGSYEIRTLETDDCYNLPDSIVQPFVDSANKKRKVSNGFQVNEMEIVPSFSRYKIIDWCYDARIVLDSRWGTRVDGLRKICMG